jgi:uncharacterized protein YqcC (DUF446 family)
VSNNRRILLQEMLKQLDLVAQELRRLGWWSDEMDRLANPQPDARSSMFGGLSFPEWLQFEFLPHARTAVRNDELPKTSQVGLMALRQYDYHSTVREALPLVALLHEFDELIGRTKHVVE